MRCHLGADDCRRADIAEALDLRPNPRRKGDFEGSCPACGHRGFALSAPTLTKMRNIWACNCKICNGGRGCAARVTRAAMIRKGVPPWCLGSYIGKDKPAADIEGLRNLAQVVDDLIACGPKVFTVSEMLMLLADGRGRKIPYDDYGECAAYAKGLGISNGTAYTIAEKFTGGSGSRPDGHGVPPHPGGEVEDTSRTTSKRNRVNTPRSEAQNLPTLGNGDSNSWKEPTLDEAPEIPTLGKQTQDDKGNRSPSIPGPRTPADESNRRPAA